MKLTLSKYKALARKRREQGLTLIEASMVLALSAVVVAGVMLYYQSASDNNRLQSALGELGSIQTAVQTLYAGQADYTGLSSVVLQGNSSIPPSNQSGSGTTFAITDPWNGSASVAVVTGTATNYTVEFDGIPPGSCTPLATQQLGSQLVGIAVNGGTQVASYTPTAAQTACTGGTLTGGLAKIVWTLK